VLAASITRAMSHESLIALMMEAASTSGTSVDFYRTARCNNSEDSHLQHFFCLSIQYFFMMPVYNSEAIYWYLYCQ
jgi:hypothetical protein